MDLLSGPVGCLWLLPSKRHRVRKIILNLRTVYRGCKTVLCETAKGRTCFHQHFLKDQWGNGAENLEGGQV